MFGKANIFHDLSGLVLATFPTMSMIPETMAPAPEVFPNSWKVLVKSTFSMICLWGIMESVAMSMIPETIAPALEVFPNSWQVLEMLVKPTFSMSCLWGIMEGVGFTKISNNFHDYRNTPNLWRWLKR